MGDMDGQGKCGDCGDEFNRFSSYDFEGKLCNKCYGNKGEGDSGFGKGMFGGL